ncbi:Ribonuclease Oy [Schistosoma japonicum]|uniref:Ribonuclease Oy n=1 Tax=Schistosoma japonicum TaxID=6182 RepID=A0A4Z2DFF8_SCHJA|nr:Ribonuclease Oy [Schistosoma japonicum]
MMNFNNVIVCHLYAMTSITCQYSHKYCVKIEYQVLMSNIFIYSLAVIVCLYVHVGFGGNNIWDIFILSVFWSPALCYHQTECDPPGGYDYFTVDGLWPANMSFYTPNCTPPVTFNMSEIQTIENKLYRTWPDINNVTISPVICNLKRYGITPSDTLQQNKSDFQMALKKLYNVTPPLWCYRSDAGEIYFLQMIVCLDKFLNFIECSQEGKNQTDDCPETFKFPAYHNTTKQSVKLINLK